MLFLTLHASLSFTVSGRADSLQGGEKFGQIERLGQRGGETGLGHLLLFAAADVAGGGDHGNVARSRSSARSKRSKS